MGALDVQSRYNDGVSYAVCWLCVCTQGREEPRSGSDACCIPEAPDLASDERGSQNLVPAAREHSPLLHANPPSGRYRRWKHSTLSPFNGGTKRANTSGRSTTTGTTPSAHPFPSRLQGRNMHRNRIPLATDARSASGGRDLLARRTACMRCDRLCQPTMMLRLY